MRASIVSFVALAIGMGVCAGCATSQRSSQETPQNQIVALADFQIQVAQSDIRAARKAGAATLAAEKLRKAEAALRSAAEQMRQRQYAEVERLTKQASAEAGEAKRIAESKRPR